VRLSPGIKPVTGGLSYDIGRGGDEGEGRRSMFERFTDRARLVVVRAQEEARTLDHDYVGTEHLLLALTQESIGAAWEPARLGSSRGFHRSDGILGRSPATHPVIDSIWTVGSLPAYHPAVRIV
jgi:Clp amino terminal domain, pathogenicity island component